MKKSTVYFLIIAPAAFVLFGVLFWFVAGPSRPTVVSQQTTYLTTPLLASGLVDYERGMLEMQSAGIRPEENAAIPLVQAMWPCDFDPEAQHVVCEALDIATPSGPGLVHSCDPANLQAIVVWLNQQQLAKPASGVFSSTEAIDVIDDAYGTPWTRAQVPPLADWIDRQAPHFAKLHEINDRPQYFLPAPSVLNDRYDPLPFTDLPSIGTWREAARSLSARAMLYIGENQPAAAWEDIKTIFSLSRCVPQPACELDMLVCCAFRGMACSELRTLLNSGQCDAALLAKIAHDLDGIAPLHASLTTADLSERLRALDAAVNLSVGRYDSELVMGEKNQALESLCRLPFDRNAMLLKINQQFDKLVAVLKIDDLEVRSAAFDKFDADLQAEIESVKQGGNIAAAVFNQTARGELIGKVLIALLFPALRQVTVAEQRVNLEFQMARVAVALEQFKLRTGDYPDSLDALADQLDPHSLADPYSTGPLRYERRRPGFLLYSLFLDRIDDGGNSLYGEIVNGEWLPTGIPSTYPNGDMVVRFPQPKKAFLNPPPWISADAAPPAASDAEPQPDADQANDP